jgi:hypothetical protein
MGFWTLSTVRYSKIYRTQCLGNWICFRPQVSGETPTVMDPLERAHLSHFRIYLFQLGYCRLPAARVGPASTVHSELPSGKTSGIGERKTSPIS